MSPLFADGASVMPCPKLLDRHELLDAGIRRASQHVTIPHRHLYRVVLRSSSLKGLLFNGVRYPGAGEDACELILCIAWTLRNEAGGDGELVTGGTLRDRRCAGREAAVTSMPSRKHFIGLVRTRRSSR